MDTVTESAMAIAMAQVGASASSNESGPRGAGQRGAQVKKFESGMVVNPVTIHPDQTLADALSLMSIHQISGIPVVERNSKLVASSPIATCASPPTTR